MVARGAVMSTAESVQLSGTRKTAILLSLLGEEASASILRNLPEDDLQRVTDEVAHLGQVPFDVTLEVLKEFQELMAAQDFMAVGGQEVACRLRVKAFGENVAKDMLQRLSRADEQNAA